MYLEVPGALYRPRRLWLLVGPLAPGGLGVLVCHRSLDLFAAPLVLAGRGNPVTPAGPAGPGLPGIPGIPGAEKQAPAP